MSGCDVQRRQRHAPRLEHGPVVDGENGTPGFAMRLEGRLVLHAVRRAARGPGAVEAVRPFLGEMGLHAVMEQHRRRHHQHAPLGGGEVAVPMLLRTGLGARQVESPAPTCGARACSTVCAARVEGVGEYLSRLVGVGQGVRRLADRVRQLGHAALRPRRRGSACFRAQRPGKRRVRKAFRAWRRRGSRGRKTIVVRPCFRRASASLMACFLRRKPVSASRTTRRPSTSATTSMRLPSSRRSGLAGTS